MSFASKAMIRQIKKRLEQMTDQDLQALHLAIDQELSRRLEKGGGRG